MEIVSRHCEGDALSPEAIPNLMRRLLRRDFVTPRNDIKDLGETYVTCLTYDK